VSREVFGLLNVWAGFPIRPDSRPTGASRVETRSSEAGPPSSRPPLR
jgi:hypothetical protein